ncbi:hypothetical protein ACFSSF_14690 [Dietzia aerolata]|uniref:hypothetical protein n=1 Tax=Dietzia aerolata TaxID=595984 RepID=UPI00363458C3
MTSPSSSITTAATDNTRSTAGVIPEVSTSTTTQPAMRSIVARRTDIPASRRRTPAHAAPHARRADSRSPA